MPDTTQRRRRHYEPAPQKTVQIWQRDLMILEAVHRYRFLTSRHILTLVDGSAQHLLKRLRALMDGGYLMRIRDPEPRAVNSGSRPKIYGLTNLGADTLAAAGIRPRDRTNWNRRNGEVSDPQTGIGIKIIPHALFIADIMVETEYAVRKTEGAVRLIEEAEILATISPEQTRRSQHPFSWHVTVPYPRFRRDDAGDEQVLVESRRVGVAFDRMFGLEFRDRPDGRNRLFFFLEADRGGMAVIRSDFEQTSIFKKLCAYSATWARGVHTERFGLKHFQVLVITRSRDRVTTMVEAFKRLERRVVPVWHAYDFDPKNLPWVFRFTDRASSSPDGILKYSWVDGRGTPRPLNIPDDL